MDTKVIKMSYEEIQDLKRKYQHSRINYNVAHTHFQIKGSDFTITAYKSGKVVFQAADLSLHLTGIETKNEKKPINTKVMSGSDEVGTGDYFGPVTVCAVYLEEEDYDYLPLHKIRDTKEISDDLVYELAPMLIDNTKHSLLILNNEKYNIIQKTNNLNQIKAKLHNQAFVHLDNKYGLPKVNIIDQFTPKDLYYRYLQGEEKIIDTLIFETKAENKYLAVACAAIIARYAFLETLRALEEKYDFIFPKGSGKIVDIKGKEFVEKFGEKELRKVAKLHFKNTERILTEHQV
ncbi:MAG TPA: ribonuclease HIII [Erysipelothrix sp.]|nr:ribonuclease HIII [Erysipelothrix sp.]